MVFSIELCQHGIAGLLDDIGNFCDWTGVIGYDWFGVLLTQQISHLASGLSLLEAAVWWTSNCLLVVCGGVRTIRMYPWSSLSDCDSLCRVVKC